MIRHLDRIGKLVLGAAFVGALGFGATQAVAAPTDTASTVKPSCSHDYCDVHCQGLGYPAGKCINWICHCYTGSGWSPRPY